MRSNLISSARKFIAEREASGELFPDTGIAVSIIRNKDILLEEGFGYRDRELRLPVTPKTIFEAGSITKSITAASLALSASRGKLNLEAPINFPDEILPLKDQACSAKLSLMDILTHRSGIPSHDMLWYFGPKEERSHKIRFLEMIPGGFKNTFHYNNLMYGCLNGYFERRLGQNYSSFVRSDILGPLGMTSACISSQLHSDDLAKPYLNGEEIPRKGTFSMEPAAGLQINVSDLSRWAEFHLNQGLTSSGHELLPEEFAARLLHPEIDASNSSPLIMQGFEWLGPKRFYGLGWFIGETRGKKAVFHMGLVDGFSAAIVLIPELKMSFSVLTNTNVSPIPGLLIQHLLCTALGELPPRPKGPTSNAESAGSVPASLSSAHEGIEGVYENLAYGRIEVIHSTAGLVLRYRDHEWQMAFQSPLSATFSFTAFGLPLSLPVSFEMENGETISRLSTPLSFDPNLPQEFRKL